MKECPSVSVSGVWAVICFNVHSIENEGLAMHILNRLAAVIYGALCFYLAWAGKPAELAGFAVAGAIALVFFDLKSFVKFSGIGFSAIIRQVEEKVDDVEKRLAPILLKETDPDINDDSKLNVASETLSDLDKSSLSVLHSLTNKNYSWRTLSGIIKDTGLDQSKIKDILHELEDKNLADTSKSSAGKTIWSATLRGHIVSAYYKIESVNNSV